MKSLEWFHNYMGTGLILIWYMAAVIYLFLKEKRKDKRILFIYVPVILLVLFFNPLFFLFFQNYLGGEIYFRLIWLLPVTVTLAYCIVRICQDFSGKKRIYFALSAAVLVVVSGTLVYSNPLFKRAENLHHVPREVVEICDMIELPGREIVAAFPLEFLYYVRQYSPMVCMPYGREVMLGEFNELEYLMRGSQIDVGRLAELAKAEKCHYVILSENKELSGKMEDYDYEVFGRSGEYLVYRDKTMDFTIWILE